MTIPAILFLLGLAFGLIEEFQAQGRSLVAWGLVFVCIGLLWDNVR